MPEVGEIISPVNKPEWVKNNQNPDPNKNFLRKESERKKEVKPNLEDRKEDGKGNVIDLEI